MCVQLVPLFCEWAHWLTVRGMFGGQGRLAKWHNSQGLEVSIYCSWFPGCHALSFVLFLPPLNKFISPFTVHFKLLCDMLFTVLNHSYAFWPFWGARATTVHIYHNIPARSILRMYFFYAWQATGAVRWSCAWELKTPRDRTTRKQPGEHRGVTSSRPQNRESSGASFKCQALKCRICFCARN